jgi:hypothetical protein
MSKAEGRGTQSNTQKRNVIRYLANVRRLPNGGRVDDQSNAISAFQVPLLPMRWTAERWLRGCEATSPMLRVLCRPRECDRSHVRRRTQTTTTPWP